MFLSQIFITLYKSHAVYHSFSSKHIAMKDSITKKELQEQISELKKELYNLKEENEKLKHFQEKQLMQSKKKVKSKSMEEPSYEISENQYKLIAKRYNSLNNLLIDLNANLTLSYVIEKISNSLLELTKAEVVFVFLAEDENLILHKQKSVNNKFHHSHTPVHKLGECLCGKAMQQKKALYSIDINKDIRCTWNECKNAGLKSFAAIPLLYKNEVIGLIGLGTGTKYIDFEKDTVLLNAVSQGISISMQNSLLYEELQSSQRALQKTQGLLNAAIEQSPAGIIIAESPGMNMLYINKMAMNLLGTAGIISKTKNIESKNWQIFDAKKNEYLPENLPLNKAVEKGKIINNEEILVKKEKNEHKWISVNASPIKDKNGNILAGIAIIKDITERKKTESELKNYQQRLEIMVKEKTEEYEQITEELTATNEELYNYKNHLEEIVKERTKELTETEQQLKTLSDNLAEGAIFRAVYDTNNKYRVIYASKQFEEILGTPKIEFEKHFIETIKRIHPEQSEEIINDIKISAELNKPIDSEVKLYKKNKDIRWIHIKAFPHMENEDVVFDGILMDITDKKLSEKTIYQSKYALDNNINPILWIQENGKIMYANRAACENLKYNLEELLKLQIFDIDMEITPESWQFGWKTISDILSSTKESKYKRKDGKIFPVEIKANYLNYDNEEYVFAFITDITEQKKYLTQLKEINDELINQRAYLDSILKVAPAGIGVVKKRNFTYVNDLVCQLLGYKPEELIGKNAHIVYPTDEDYNYAGKEKYNQIAKFGIGSIETKWIKKNGEIIHVILNSTPINPDKLDLGVTFTVLDITKQKRIQAELKESEELYRTLISTLPDAVSMVDIDGKFIFSSPQHAAIHGYEDPEEVINKYGIELLDESELERASKIFEKTLLKGFSKNNELLLKRKDGTTFYGGINFSCLYDSNKKPKAFVVTTRDITERKKAEEALIQSEKKFRNIVESSPMGMHLYHLNKKRELIFTGANPAADKILRVDHTQFISKTIEEAFPPLKESVVPMQYELAAKEGSSWETQQIDYKDDQIAGAFEVHAFQTSPNNMCAMFLDITERKTAEEALKVSEKNYREIFNATSDAIFVFDINTNQILDLNNQMIEMYGFTKEEFLTEDPTKFMANTPPYTLDNALKKLIKATNNKPLRYEWLAKKKDGTIFWTEIHLKQAKIGGQDRILGVVRDISERKNAEKALKESEEKFRALFEGANDGIILLSTDRVCIDCNNKALEIFNCTREQILGKTPVDFSPENQPNNESSTKVMAKLKKEFHNKGSIRFEWLAKRLDGALLPCELTLNKIVLQNETFTQGIIRDISERKQIEQKILETIITTEEVEREKFAKNLHDELGPLLSSIKMYANTMHENNDEKKILFIQKQLNELIKEAIDTTKSISYDLSPHVLTNYGLNASIESFIHKVEHLIKIEYESNLGNLRYSSTVETTLFRIIKELINNTISHAKASKIQIKLLEKQGINLYFKDNGKGFNTDKIKDPNKKGMGLNNIISRIQSLNGNIKIQRDTKNQGMVFEIMMPLK